MISSILLLLASNTMTMGHETIELNSNNVLTIRGTITEDNVNDFVFDLNKMENKQDIYVYLDTNGGSVHAGIKVVSEVQKHNISCIAHRAYSMGFVILQSCAKRYVTPYATVMQHQISYGASSEKAKVESYVNFVDQVGDQLEKMQSDKIGLCVKDFTQKTYNDWWLAGDNILSENVADKIVHVTCTKELTESNYTKDGFFGEIVYSRCPLVSNPIN
jgi:ATP-dependent protease ClpP protease subunit